ncbi:hypothetical protein BDZ91DRAFT_781014 [Kalaharituber pfeilii]|nr:hypothetical protein BDZ91DRAFT_781014 [Kalaharituber pfeilii]
MTYVCHCAHLTIYPACCSGICTGTGDDGERTCRASAARGQQQRVGRRASMAHTACIIGHADQRAWSALPSRRVQPAGCPHYRCRGAGAGAGADEGLLHVKAAGSSNAATQQRSSNAAATQQQRSSNAAATQQQRSSNAAATQQGLCSRQRDSEGNRDSNCARRWNAACA